MELHQNMRNEENIGQIVRGKRFITSLSLTYKIYPIYQFICYQEKQQQQQKKTDKKKFRFSTIN